MMLLKQGSDFAGRYEIIRVLSTGGMGVVYEVLHRDTQRKRALKLMLPSLLSDDDMRARFAREAIVTAGIESEHLVEVFDAGVEKESGCPFLVMELLRGEDLGARLQREERTSPREVLEITDQLTRALVRTHEAGIVHRDLKPENVFVTRREDGTLRMKILDFGIAKLVDRGGKSTRSVGTPIYMAPEQMTGKGVGAAADTYALAQIAFTLLVGAPYFQREADTAENVLGLMSAVGAGTIEPATVRGASLGVHLPAAFDAWFARATHRDPGSRFASVRQQTDALHAVLDDAPDALPVSSGAKRRAAAFGATEAMPERSDGGSAPPPAGRDELGDSVRPDLAPARVDRSAAPARTHVSPPMSASASESAAGPSSRTLAGESATGSRVKALPVAVGLGVVAAAAIALGLAFRAPDPAPLGNATSEHPAASPPTVSAAGAAASSAPPAIEVAPAESVGAPPPPSAVPSAAPSVVPSASASPSTRATPRGPAGPPRASASAPPPPPPSTPPATPGTVWAGPRR